VCAARRGSALGRTGGSGHFGVGEVPIPEVAAHGPQAVPGDAAVAADRVRVARVEGVADGRRTGLHEAKTVGPGINYMVTNLGNGLLLIFGLKIGVYIEGISGHEYLLSIIGRTQLSYNKPQLKP
jgi:hypothetical protein